MKIATLNLRADSDRWDERFPLVVDTLHAADADVIALQEVRIKIQQAQLIADTLNQRDPQSRYTVHLCKDWFTPHILANAILARVPAIAHERIELPQGFRTAQRLLFALDGREVLVANTHLHHKPYRDETIRLPQMRYLLDWLAQAHRPYILVGDMNARPASVTIQHAKHDHGLRSAHETVQGREPAQTFPTPLRTDKVLKPRAIDYIFCTAHWQITACRVIGDQPHPADATLYPSDHFGLVGACHLR